jgi:quinol monooxygenase YgiN
MLRHIVLFRFKDSATPAQLDALTASLVRMVAQFPAITQFEWGPNVSLEGKNKEFSHAFVMTFTDAAALADYIPHPLHQAWVDELRPLEQDVLVIDFEI